jgi:large subunit ribosomal protein L29
MKAKEMRDQPDNQLEILIEDLEKEIFELRNELVMTKKIEHPHLIKQKRRDRARAITILSERKMKACEGKDNA